MLWHSPHATLRDRHGGPTTPWTSGRLYAIDTTKRAALPQFWQTGTVSAGRYVLDAGIRGCSGVRI